MSADGTTVFLDEKGNPKGSFVPAAANNTFTLMIGADHAHKASWGADTSNNITLAGNGYMKMLQDGGLKPYMATTTGTVGHNPGDVDGMGWANLRTLQKRGVEMLSHSHFHVQRWDRLNTGVFIGYNGLGTTATCHVTATQVILTVTGTNAATDSATLTRSSYATIGDLLAAIRAINGTAWDANIQNNAALLGTEPTSCLLPIVAARNVKGTPSGNNRLFCCGGGIQVVVKDSPYVVANPLPTTAQVIEHLKIRIRTNGWIEVTIDGVPRLYADLSATANDTFAELVAVLNTNFNSLGVAFYLADNGALENPDEINYMRGDELSSSLKYFTNHVISPANLALIPTVMEVGLTQDYMRERQYDKSIETAAANGVKFVGFAEPGNQWWPWHMKGYRKFKAYRGTLHSRLNQQPVTYPLSSLKSPYFVRSSCIWTGGYTTTAHMVALAEAMADSPGHACCLLWHKLSTTEGRFGYELGTENATMDQTAQNVAAFLTAIKPHLKSGKITAATLGEAADAIGMGREPFNYLFNSGLKNPGVPMPAVSGNAIINDTAMIPGWILNLSATPGASINIRSDGMLVLNSPTAVADFSIKQSLILDRTSDWEYGMDVREATLTAGSGASISIIRTMGRTTAGNNIDVGASVVAPVTQAGLEIGTSGGYSGVGHINGKLSFARSSTGFDAARIVGLVPTSVTIVAGTNDVISLSINGLSPGASLTMAPGVRTMVSIADEINAWMKTDSIYSTYPEFGNIAKARRAGRTGPVLILGDLPNVYKIVATSTNTSSAGVIAVLGGIHTGAGHVGEGYFGPDLESGLFAQTYSLQANFQGMMVIGRPYMKKLEMM